MENRYAIGITNRYALFMEEGESSLAEIKERKARQKKAKRKKIAKAKQALNPFKDYKIDESTGEVVKRETKTNKNDQNNVNDVNETKKSDVDENSIKKEKDTQPVSTKVTDNKPVIKTNRKSKKEEELKSCGIDNSGMDNKKDEKKLDQCDDWENIKEKPDENAKKIMSGAARRAMRLGKYRDKDVEKKNENEIDINDCITYGEWLSMKLPKNDIKLNEPEAKVEIPSTSQDMKEKAEFVTDDSQENDQQHQKTERKDRTKRPTRYTLPNSELNIRCEGSSRRRGGFDINCGSLFSDQDGKGRRKYRPPAPRMDDEKAFPHLVKSSEIGGKNSTKK